MRTYQSDTHCPLSTWYWMGNEWLLKSVLPPSVLGPGIINSVWKDGQTPSCLAAQSGLSVSNKHPVSGGSEQFCVLDSARAQVLFQLCSFSGVMTSMYPLEWLDGPQTPCTLHTPPSEQWCTNPGCHNETNLSG